MRIVTRTRIVVAVAATLLVASWALSPGLARTPAPTPNPGGFGGGAQQDEPVPERVYIAQRLNGEMAKSWAKLERRSSIPFAQETSLEDVLNYFRTATGEGPDKKNGIQFYVDPVGLQEAEKTMGSPITLNLEDVPVSTALDLILKQLGLRYYVHNDGFVMITSANENSNKDASAFVLDELAALRREVKELRAEIRAGANHHHAPNASAPGAMQGPPPPAKFQ
jgi:hypothetical protein